MQKILKKMVTFIKLISKGLFIRMCWVFPIQENKIVFSSFRGRQYSDHPASISSILEEREDLDIVWLLNPEVECEKKTRRVTESSWKALYELATARVWVDNCRKRIWISKRKGQYYIQTWHGNIAGKRVEGDANLTALYNIAAKNDSKMANLFISGSAWSTKNYRDAFWYNGEILECGCPRSDIFYGEHEEISRKVRAFYSIDDDVRIALYAPTFRQDKRTDCYNLDYQRILVALEKYWKGKWVLLVRLHPNLTHVQSIIPYSGSVLNGLLYQDINEEIIACDFLITDYSSCMFDAMEAGKNVMIYASDIKDYDSERGRYFTYEEMPFMLAEDNDTMESNIAKFDPQTYRKQVNEFMNRLGIITGGTASKQVADHIISVMHLN